MAATVKAVVQLVIAVAVLEVKRDVVPYASGAVAPPVKALSVGSSELLLQRQIDDRIFNGHQAFVLRQNTQWHCFRKYCLSEDD